MMFMYPFSKTSWYSTNPHMGQVVVHLNDDHLIVPRPSHSEFSYRDSHPIYEWSAAIPSGQRSGWKIPHWIH